MPGTAIATKELSELPNEGSRNKVFRSYELVMFTKHAMNLEAARDETTPFGKAHRSMSAILEHVARYSSQAVLNPLDTFEFAEDVKRVGGRCLIFDEYACHSDDVAQDFGLLLIMEIFRSEMDFARKSGGVELIARLKSHGHYPYSDLERAPVA